MTDLMHGEDIFHDAPFQFDEKWQMHKGWAKDCRRCEEIFAAIKAEKERCAKKAEELFDFGPSTQCPDCGSNGQVLHWYKLGREDAAKDIREE